LSSTQIPKKNEVLPNVQRFKDPAVDAAVTKLAAATDRETQKSDLEPLVETMMTQYPVTSLIYAPARVIYRTDKAVGWPSEQDPYANPTHDNLLMLPHRTAPK